MDNKYKLLIDTLNQFWIDYSKYSTDYENYSNLFHFENDNDDFISPVTDNNFIQNLDILLKIIIDNKNTIEHYDAYYLYINLIKHKALSDPELISALVKYINSMP